MKALSGVERVWSGAKATEREPSPAPRVHRHLAVGGRIGEVVSREAGDMDRTPADRPADITVRDRAATRAS